MGAPGQRIDPKWNPYLSVQPDQFNNQVLMPVQNQITLFSGVPNRILNKYILGSQNYANAQENLFAKIVTQSGGIRS